MKVAVTCIHLIRDLDIHRSAFAAAGLDVTTPEIPGQHLEGDDLVAALDGCAGVVAGDDTFSRSVLERLPHLRVISKWGIGVDGIDHAAARDLGIEVRNTPGVFDDEVADVAMAYVVALARQLHHIDRGVRDGRWPKPAGTSLRGAVLGIIGLGGIGRALAVRAGAAGMILVGSDPSSASCDAARSSGVDAMELDELLRRSDFISINCPLNDSTFHLLDDAAFSLTRPGVRVVNTGRGAVIDTDALVRALRSGQVGAAALDVLEEEPPGPNHPLRAFEHVVFGSHNASNTVEASARVHEMAIRNLVEALGVTSS